MNIKGYYKKNWIFLLVILTVQISITLLYLSGTLQVTSLGVPLDDSWIYFSYARNLATYGELSFNQGKWSTGITSPLWTVLLSFGTKLGFKEIVTSLILGILFHIISALTLFEILKRTFTELISIPNSKVLHKKDQKKKQKSFITPSGLSLFVVLLFLLCGNLIWFSLSGMETSMFITWGLLSIYAFTRKRFVQFNIFSSLLVLTRIEGIVLIGLCILIELFKQIRSKRSRNWKNLVSMLTCSLLVLGSIFLFNYLLSKQLLPTTFEGRKWLFGTTSSWNLGFESIRDYVRMWTGSLIFWTFTRLSYRNFYGGDVNVLVTLYLSVLFVFLLIGAGRCLQLLYSYFKDTKYRTEGLLLLFLWFILHNLVYVVLFPTHAHAGRYQAINFVALWIFLTIGATTIYQLLRNLIIVYVKRSSPLLPVTSCYVISLIFLFIIALSTTFSWRKVYVYSVNHINQVHIKSGAWINNNLPKRAIVGAFDIGAIKYYGDRTIVDISGLIDPEFKSYLSSNRVADYMKSRRVNYLAVIEFYDKPRASEDRLGIYQQDGVYFDLIPLKSFQVPPREFWIHFNATWNALPKMVIYKIQWR